MRIVVDTNIAFSAILNTNSKIASIILKPKTSINFYSTDLLLLEIIEHKDKLKKISKYSNLELDRIIVLILRKIRLIIIQLISKEIIKNSELLTQGVDIDDTEFIALTDHSKAKLWSGDKALIAGLNNKG